VKTANEPFRRQQAGENEEGHGAISFILISFQIMKKRKNFGIMKISQIS